MARVMLHATQGAAQWIQVHANKGMGYVARYDGLNIM